MFRRGGHDEPRIDGDAVPAHARSRLKYPDPGVAVGEFDDPPNIEAELVADQRQLVGKRDVDVAKRILRQLDQLGRRRVCAKQFPLQEDAIERLGVLGTSFGHTADDPVVLDQLANHAARQHPLRAMGDMHIERFTMAFRGKAKIGPQPGELAGEPPGRADR